MTDLPELLQTFYTEKLTLLLRHESVARLIGQYDANNTYQYIIAREEVHLSWIAQAIVDLGSKLPEPPTSNSPTTAGRGDEAVRAALAEDVKGAQLFVDRWRARVDAMSNARHRNMLRVVLGEVLEQKRFFEQALAGRTDLLGRRAQQLGPAHGEVLPTRWIE